MSGRGRFSGKVVLVAGGTGGLGSAVAEAFLMEGAKTVVTYLAVQDFEDMKKSLGATAKELEGRGRNRSNQTRRSPRADRVYSG